MCISSLEKQIPWVKKVKNLINGLGHSYIINNINSIKPNLNTIKQRIH